MKYTIIGGTLYRGEEQYPIAHVKKSWVRKNVFRKIVTRVNKV